PLFGDEGGAQHAEEEDEGEQGVDEGLLAARVVGQGAGVPVDGGQQVAHAAAEADHQRVDGEGPAALLLAGEQVRQQGLQRREAGLAAELDQANARHQQQHLQEAAARRHQGGQAGRAGDQPQAEQHARAQRPDEGPPPPEAPAPPVAGAADHGHEHQPQHRAQTCRQNTRRSGLRSWPFISPNAILHRITLRYRQTLIQRDLHRFCFFFLLTQYPFYRAGYILKQHRLL
ncbi:hypothetical protein ANANG_G00244250, partial [Anguilla anguilla]